MIIKNAITCLSRTILYLVYFRNIQLHLGKSDSKIDFCFTLILPVYINEAKQYLLHIILNISISRNNFWLGCICILSQLRNIRTHTHTRTCVHICTCTHVFLFGSFVLASSQKNSCVCKEACPVSMRLRQANKNRMG